MATPTAVSIHLPSTLSSSSPLVSHIFVVSPSFRLFPLILSSRPALSWSPRWSSLATHSLTQIPSFHKTQESAPLPSLPTLWTSTFSSSPTTMKSPVISLQGTIEAEHAPRAQILASLAPQYTFSCLIPPTHPLIPPTRPPSVLSVDSDLSFATAFEDPPPPSVPLELESYLGSGTLFDGYSASLGGQPIVARILDPSLNPVAVAKAREEAELYSKLENLQGSVAPRFYGLWHGKLEDLVGRGEYERELLVMLVEDCGQRLDKLFALGSGSCTKPEDARRLFTRLREVAGEVAGDVYCLRNGELRIAGLRPARVHAAPVRTEGAERPQSVDIRLANSKQPQPPQRPHPRRPPPPPPMPKLPPSPVSPPPPSPCQKSEAGTPLPEPPKSCSSSYIAGQCSPTFSVASRPSVKFPERPVSLPPPAVVETGAGTEEKRASVLTFNQNATSALASALRASSPPPELVGMDEVEGYEPEEQLRKKRSWLLKSKPSLRSLKLFRRKEKEKVEYGQHLEVVV